MSETTETKFDQWCILDLFGHQRTAGHVTEATIGGCAFLRIDVPEGEGYRTEYYGQGAIYSMRPVSEEIAREVVRSHASPPVSTYDMSHLLKRLEASKEAEAASFDDTPEFL
jgi:hypothetical protein